ncbi:hypothetical protein DT076_01965 [Desertihabitans brevis]|uniref:Uncharacterized protein n=1 Tax=Desertihabitans brevis TaxID=2268447 RepID=A0A367Z0E3_9ACTN|nr:sialidase family protein [Desertihabitans brevis]RCK71239.1 hypothetical protein DT076_01965 [Desertihabitans brevis]
MPTKFDTTVAGGDLPDVVYVPTDVAQLPRLMEAKFHDLTELLSGDAVAEYPALANLSPDLWRGCVFNGRIWGIPVPRAMARTSNPLYRAAGNTLLYAAPTHPRARKCLSVFVSTDGGRSCERRAEVTSDRSGYSDLVMVDDTHLGVLYETGLERGDARDRILYKELGTERRGLQGRSGNPATGRRRGHARSAGGAARLVCGRPASLAPDVR